MQLACFRRWKDIDFKGSLRKRTERVMAIYSVFFIFFFLKS